MQLPLRAGPSDRFRLPSREAEGQDLDLQGRALDEIHHGQVVA